jgi:hypothetical protein
MSDLTADLVKKQIRDQTWKYLGDHGIVQTNGIYWGLVREKMLRSMPILDELRRTQPK